MQEIELKFQIPKVSLAAVLKALTPRGQARPPARTRLQAIYFDTDDRRLAAAGVALRLRKEGRHWVQTLKATGAHAMQRLEHNVNVPLAAGLRPGIDIQRHAATEAGDRLVAALAQGGAAPALRETFATDIWRRTRSLRTRLGTLEIALDEGWITAGAARLPICELEIELLSGHPQAVINEARRWVQTHGLWLDTRTKAHRGEHLARNSQPSPSKAGLPTLSEDATLAASSRALHAKLLDAILMNASVLAGGEGQPEHIHQLRVGLRRVRTVWRLLEGCSALPQADTQAAVVELFRRLGEARDVDVLADFVPKLTAFGGPIPEWRTAQTRSVDVGAVLRSAATTQAWLSLIEASLPGSPSAAAGASDDPLLKPMAIARLSAWHRKAVKQVARFRDLSVEQRHSLRKLLKRLRYGIDSVLPLLPKKAVRGYLKLLRPAQEALGELNDMAVAHDAFAKLVEHDPKAWFALGWMAARREALLLEAQRQLEAWALAPRFWK